MIGTDVSRADRSMLEGDAKGRWLRWFAAIGLALSFLSIANLDNHMKSAGSASRGSGTSSSAFWTMSAPIGSERAAFGLSPGCAPG